MVSSLQPKVPKEILSALMLGLGLPPSRLPLPTLLIKFPFVESSSLEQAHG